MEHENKKAGKFQIFIKKKQIYENFNYYKKRYKLVCNISCFFLSRIGFNKKLLRSKK